MNFMDLYLDAQKYHEKIDEPEKDINHNEIYRQYCECSLAIYEANNFIDLYYIQDKYTLYAESSTFIKAVMTFMVGAILLLIKIVIGLKAAILGAGLLFIMWVLKKMKGAFKKENINTGSSGGGGGSSHRTKTISLTLDMRMIDDAEDKILRDRIFKAAPKYKSQKVIDFISGIDGYDKIKKTVMDECTAIGKKKRVYWKAASLSTPPKEYLEMIQDAVKFGLDNSNIGAFHAREKYGDFLMKCLEKCITSGVSLRNNSYKELMNKQPFYRIKYDAGLRKTAFSKLPDVSMGEFSGDVILNCDSFIAMSLTTQLAMMQFIDGENADTNYQDLYKRVTENLSERAKSNISDISKRYKIMFVENAETNSEEKLMQVLDSCEYKLKSIDEYNTMSKFYASVKTEQISNPKLEVVKLKQFLGPDIYDIVFDGADEKAVWVDILKYTRKAIEVYDGGYSPDRLKASINALTESGKKLKDTFDKIDMSSKSDEIKKHQAFIKKVQEFSINILTIVNQSVMMGPASINNGQNKVYEELMYDLGIIVYSIVSEVAFSAFMNDKDSIDNILEI